jgi:two-component system chemotaxis response regulator CheY
MAKILIVDDAAFMRTLLKNILFPKGYEIAGEAENGAVAVQKYKELKPDLVTMDIVMPNKNGIDALKEIRAMDPNAKVIMCTAVGQESMVRTAILNGARGYIVKPFQAPKVLEEVQKVLGA